MALQPSYNTRPCFLQVFSSYMWEFFPEHAIGEFLSLSKLLVVILFKFGIPTLQQFLWWQGCGFLICFFPFLVVLPLCFLGHLLCEAQGTSSNHKYTGAQHPEQPTNTWMVSPEKDSSLRCDAFLKQVISKWTTTKPTNKQTQNQPTKPPTTKETQGKSY